MPKPVYYFITPWRPSMKNDIDIMSDGSRTVFVPLRYLYPECMVLIEKDPQLYPLQCLRTSCPRNQNCMEVLAQRVKYFFEKVTPDAGLMIAYYKWNDKPHLLRAGVFDRSLEDPRQIVCKKSSFRKFQKDGDTYRWDPPSDFYLMGGRTNTIIPVEGLIRG